MNRFIAAAVLAVLSLTYVTAQTSGRHIILPNTKLLGCRGSTCGQLWQDEASDWNAVYPWQVSTDVSEKTVIGLTALYDKPVTFNEVKSAIEERYGKWAFLDLKSTGAKVWRIESEKFIISATPMKNGMVQVIYLVFDAKHPQNAEKSCNCD